MPKRPCASRSAHAPSLITLDIQLPGADGWELLARMRQVDALVNVPVVVIAGLAQSRAMTKDPAVVVLQKPISRAELRTSMASLGLEPVPQPQSARDEQQEEA